MKKTAFFAFSFYIFGFSPAFSQERCNSVLELSKLRNATLSDESEIIQHANRFCDEYSKSSGKTKSKSLSASYKLLSGSFAKGSASYEEVASRYCSAKKLSEFREDSYKQYVESIAPRAYAAYEALYNCKTKLCNLQH